MLAQSVSNEGMEFWSVFPTHEADNSSLATLSLFITGSQASSGKITVGTFSTSFSLAANAVLEVPIPRSAAYINDVEGNRILTNRAIHIAVDTGKPKIVVYSHIFAGRRSAASLILPKQALGQQYFSMNYTQDDAGQNYITIVATEPNTKIHLKKGNVEIVPGGIVLNNVNDVYEYLSPTDLTGVSVSVDSLTSACNSFALFTGSSGVRIGVSGCDPQSIDPLYQQCYPVTSWGKNYGFIPFSTKSPNFATPVRTAGQYARIVAKENGTIVSINALVVSNLNIGEFYTTTQPITTTSYITANKPISVAQYALTQSCSNINQSNDTYSDPDMVILNPIEYNINHINIYSATKENIAEQYINILIKTSAANSFKINNNVPLAPFITMSNLPGYSYLQLSLNNLGTSTFNLSANEGFNAIAYGFGNVESYSYSAGTNLASNESISAVLANSNLAIDSTCINNDYFFKLTLPYQSPQISWQMDASESPVIQNNPVGTPVIGQATSYEYTFPKTPAYKNAGKHNIKILAQYPLTIGGCSKTQEEIDYSFTVIPIPIVNFSAQSEKCHNIIDFTNLTTSNTVNNIVGRIWDFGDGTTSNLQNPIHAYSDSGRYIVRLTTSFSTGCQDSKFDTLIIKQKLYPGFTFINPDCANHAVTFTDISKTTDFIIAMRKWNFGDGDSLLVNNNLPVQHIYKAAGSYTVALTLTNTEGCVSIPYTKAIVIYDNPIPDFKLPAVCINDRIAQFIDQTTIPSNSEKPFTYQWDFGDPNATALNANTSTLQHPTHSYTAAMNYPVTLTVTTPQGCQAIITKNFTVNGASPVASFKLLTNQVCSNNAVIVQNTSKVNFGNITKLEWHFDNVTHPDSLESYTDSIPRRIFFHHYPVFHTPLSKIYTIRLLVYSGTQCFADTLKNVTILAAPQATFDSLSNVCISTSPFKIIQGHETSGLAGAGIYMGDGTLADGTFTPATAGPGLHTIKYKFTSVAGCEDSISRKITVLTDPTVDAGSDVKVYLGDQIKLNTKTTGQNLTYKWTPTTGLDHDDIANPIASPDKDITYTVTVSNGTCQAIDDVNVLVIQPLVIPNTFTPNGDYINDTWNIKNLSYYYPDVRVDIYTKYGKHIFNSVGYSAPWDGTYKGHAMPVDTYYYIINLNNGQKPIASWLELIR